LFKNIFSSKIGKKFNLKKNCQMMELTCFQHEEQPEMALSWPHLSSNAIQKQRQPFTSTNTKDKLFLFAIQPIHNLKFFLLRQFACNLPQV